MKANRGKESIDSYVGACFTVSYMPQPNISRFVAFPALYQSGILAFACKSESNDKSCPVNFTLTYDHTLIDAMYGADFLNALGKNLMEQL
jgi:pyruvate/2-oxoglutarate dehydrogenase complex dihydrolipoamide acyltransferase (E2) component